MSQLLSQAVMPSCFSSPSICSVMLAFDQSHVSGKLICLVLIASSIVAWSIMITKIWELRKAASESRLFIAAYRKEAHPVSTFLKPRRYESSPLWPIYQKTCKALSALLGPCGVDEGELFEGFDLLVDIFQQQVHIIHFAQHRHILQ